MGLALHRPNPCTTTIIITITIAYSRVPPPSLSLSLLPTAVYHHHHYHYHYCLQPCTTTIIITITIAYSRVPPPSLSLSLFSTAALIVTIRVAVGQQHLCPNNFGDYNDGGSCVTFIRCQNGVAYRLGCPRAQPFFDRQARRCTNQQQINCVQNNQAAVPVVSCSFLNSESRNLDYQQEPAVL